ncbi:hypothetical protein [Nocardioides sp. AE5]|uniref:hypothetical protein n=1 Tax=Nocardioides sp. AE5 TaxID=2962573 RepID=UPI0028826E61|nr:hypothetical protein [Nocardioides sp. AE5]MDT0201271.1 hypothetical protein [Nocardioides sp. AE5]
MASERTARALRQALVVVLTFIVAGVVCGWLWHQVWAPAPEGFVYQHVPRFEDDEVIRSTGLYFLIAAAAGLLLGLVLTWWFEADEVITLAAVVLGALVAGWVMIGMGAWLGPESMEKVAAGAEDWTELKASMEVAGAAPWVAFPGGALAGAFVILVCFRSRAEAAARARVNAFDESAP